MVVIISAATAAANAATVANLSRMRRRGTSGNGYQKSSKEQKRKEPPALLKEKFEEAWKKQEDRLSKLLTHEAKDEYDSFSCSDYSESKSVYRYENGKMSSSHYSNSDGGEIFCRFDELENCIECNSTKRVYYPNSKQKEFEWTEKGGIKHFDKDGVEDTKIYFAKQHVEKKKEEQLKKLEDKPKLQKAAAKIADSKAFNNIAVSVAKTKFKKSQGK
ncbi:MAG TPA: hypothetical protein DIC64_04225 [Alphaproteobacteria bacterium]|nr:hypothetical protein [Alphaproteobacteria bacterium]